MSSLVGWRFITGLTFSQRFVVRRLKMGGVVAGLSRGIKMPFWNNPFFWAFLAMIGWFLGLVVVGSRTLGHSRLFGAFVVALAEIPRIILPLPFINQSRFGDGVVLPVVGGVILIVALVFGTPAFLIEPFTGPQKEEALRTTGLYGVVRHPIMFCDVFWPLGWSLVFRSSIGTSLVVVWFLVAYLLTIFEEEKLIEVYGAQYLKYRESVPRIIPFLKFL
jgi:protein-S-isoprenylcysteine O-methyltransferase Ste14